MARRIFESLKVSKPQRPKVESQCGDFIVRPTAAALLRNIPQMRNEIIIDLLIGGVSCPSISERSQQSPSFFNGVITLTRAGTISGHSLLVLDSCGNLKESSFEGAA